MSRIESRLNELGLTLPAPLTPPPGAKFNFELVKVHNGLAYIAGHGPFDGSTPLVQGRRRPRSDGGTGLRGRAHGRPFHARVAEARARRPRSRNAVAARRRIRAVRAGLRPEPAVVNGFSDLIVELWGDAGRHVRSAPGQGPSPYNVPIIVDAIAAVSE